MTLPDDIPPLSDAATARIRARVRAEARAARLAAVEGALYRGFAFATVAWAFWAVGG